MAASAMEGMPWGTQDLTCQGVLRLLSVARQMRVSGSAVPLR